MRLETACPSSVPGQGGARRLSGKRISVLYFRIKGAIIALPLKNKKTVEGEKNENSYYRRWKSGV